MYDECRRLAMDGYANEHRRWFSEKHPALRRLSRLTGIGFLPYHLLCTFFARALLVDTMWKPTQRINLHANALVGFVLILFLRQLALLCVHGIKSASNREK